MRRATLVAICLAALLAAAVGCGSSGSGTSGGSTTDGPAGVGSSKPPARLQTGIKGENPTTEAASSAHLSGADCKALAKVAEARLGQKLTRASTPKPPLSECRLEGHGASVSVYLDTGHGAHRRYRNRIEETVQFNAQHPAGLPRYVPHVGEKAYENLNASWIPALGSLLAVRGNRWLTVTISVPGRSDKQLLAEASVLARAGFKLTAHG